MNVAKWTGIIAAVLALGCAGQQSETRTTTAAQRGSATGGGNPDSTAANETAPSQRPSSGAGSQDPHPVATNPDDPQYSGDKAREGAVARPGLEGRPGMERDESRRAGAAAAAGTSGVKELDEVYGQVNEVSDDEIEIEPAYGDPIKLKLDEQTMGGQQASATGLKEGDEVRASYEEKDGDKVAVDLRTGEQAQPIGTSSSSSPSDSSMSSPPMKSEPSKAGTGTDDMGRGGNTTTR